MEVSEPPTEKIAETSEMEESEYFDLVGPTTENVAGSPDMEGLSSYGLVDPTSETIVGSSEMERSGSSDLGETELKETDYYSNLVEVDEREMEGPS